MRSSKYECYSCCTACELCTLVSVAAAAALIAMPASASACAAYVHVYGGPSYNETTQTGLDSASLPVNPGSTVSNAGAAVGSAYKWVGGQGLGTRAIRWDASGAAASELGHLGTNAIGGTTAQAYAVNAAGTAVGYASKWTNGEYLERRAVRWDASGTAATELGNLGTDIYGATNCTAWDINAAGTAVGNAPKYNNGVQWGASAVRWYASGTAATELGNLGTNSDGVALSGAWAVNDAGTTVGWAEKYTENGGERAVRWDGSGTAATELGGLGTNAYSHALGINFAGTAVGYSHKYTAMKDFGLRAVRWDASGTVATELDALGTDSAGVTQSRAHAINDAGTAIGRAEKYVDGTWLGPRAVRWDAGGSAVTELGELGPIPVILSHSTTANAINAAGIIVGTADKWTDGIGRKRAVLWGPDAVAFDLNTLIDPDAGWNLYDARAISDTNWVSGEGLFDPDGAGPLASYSRGFLMQLPASIPEPGTASVMLIGAISLTRRGRRVRS